ncbi:hypothetical protein JTB14_020815 [Gonioctena quinquepunctata]|nr:hypothetical protein JTB14_020815 [Gonioctena quinquepunctata]
MKSEEKSFAVITKNISAFSADQMITGFIIFNKFNKEKVKEQLDMYYTMRSLYPEYFQDKHPLLPHMQENMERINEIPTSDRNGLSVDEDEIVQYKIDLEEEWKPGPGGPVGNGDQQETHRTKYPD